jgi:hypothetical protein
VPGASFIYFLTPANQHLVSAEPGNSSNNSLFKALLPFIGQKVKDTLETKMMLHRRLELMPSVWHASPEGQELRG